MASSFSYGHTRLRSCSNLFSLVVSFVLLATNCLASISATDLRCEHLTNPLGIDVIKPRLSWKLTASERAQTQFAYQIVVASSEANLKANRGDLWDSGQVVSSQSILLPYSGKPLASHTE